MYYPCSENKGADQIRDYREPDLHLYFRICKKPVFSQRGSNDDFSENKGADPLHGSGQLICAVVFAYAKRRFSYDGFHIWNDNREAFNFCYKCYVLIQYGVK